MGTLYLGRTEGPGGFERLAAIKIPHAHLSQDPSFVKMFLEEARISALLHHPNVVMVYEVGEHQGQHFIVMDYIHGENLNLALSRVWKNSKSFPYELAAYVIATATEGLHSVHELRGAGGRPLNVVHRDISPGNIMIGYDGSIRLMDFGIAKAADSLVNTRTGFRKGKASYMAPEQIRDLPLDRRADVFAMGIVLWETTTGRRLFKASNEVATIMRVLESNVPRPSSLCASYPMELERIVLKALQARPEHRYETARELAEDLREFLRQRSCSLSSVDVERFMASTFQERRVAQMAMLDQAMAPPSKDASELEHQLDLTQRLDVLSREEVLNRGLEELRFKPSPQPRRQLEKTLFAPPRAPRGSPWPLALGLLLGGLGGLLLLSALWTKAQRTPPSPAAFAPPPAQSAPPARVTLTFELTPRTATIELDGQRQLSPIKVIRSQTIHRVKVWAMGYKTKVLTIVPDRSQRLVIQLERIDAPPAQKTRLRDHPRLRLKQIPGAPQRARPAPVLNPAPHTAADDPRS